MTARDHYLAAFETREQGGALGTPSWLTPLRRSAIAYFAEAGFPTTRDENWRYTNVAPLATTPFTPADTGAPDALPTAALAHLSPGDPEWPRLVFVDGRYSARHSSRRARADRVRITPLADVLTADALTEDGALVERHLARHATWEGNVFAALSTAFVEDGALVHVSADAAPTAPIELVFVASAAGVLAQPRILIVVEPRSRVTVIERYVGLVDEAYLTNVVTEIVVGAEAAVDHYVVQEQGRAAFHVSTVHASLARDSVCSSSGVTFGGRLARTTLTVALQGEGARAGLQGLYVLDGHQHVDNHVTVDHAVPRGTSRQLYKGVLDGSSRAVFNGRIVVRPDAQKTDATQTNKHLLLSDGVEVDSKPQLEIFADDVRCTHGAAEGQLVPEALFYLRSRGLGEAAARALLTYGFAHEVLERIAVEPLRAHLDEVLMIRLGTKPSDRADERSIG